MCDVEKKNCENCENSAGGTSPTSHCCPARGADRRCEAPGDAVPVGPQLARMGRHALGGPHGVPRHRHRC